MDSFSLFLKFVLIKRSESKRLSAWLLRHALFTAVRLGLVLKGACRHTQHAPGCHGPRSDRIGSFDLTFAVDFKVFQVFSMIFKGLHSF